MKMLTIKEIIKGIIFSYSSENFVRMLVAFMMVVITVEYLPRIIIVDLCIGLVVISLLLRGLFEAFEEPDKGDKKK